MAFGQPRLDDAADQPCTALGVDRLQPRRLADQLAGLAAGLGEQHRHRHARLGHIECPRLLAKQRLQRREPGNFHRFRQLIAHCRTRRAGTAAVLEGVGRRETDLLDQPHGVVEVAIAFARKADDEVGRQSEIRPRRAQAIDEPEKKIAAVAGDSSPRGCGPSPTAPAGAGRASAAAPRHARRSARRPCRADARSCSGCARCPRSRPARGSGARATRSSHRLGASP